ncbi:SRPBCC domain-containing protein [Microbacterium sp. 22242]|uniref:SRPBCC domain-containing protein n=1 Tax=Microbacterium sp. 22242 TaxID=3453896 RepID=UPI003F863B19
MGRTDEVGMHIAAPADRIYAAFIDPDAVIRWLPPDGMAGRILLFDARPGGRYRIVLEYLDPAEAHGKTSRTEDLVEGLFLEFEDGVRVVQEAVFASDDPEFAGTMRMTWEVRPAEGGSFVTIRAEDVPPGIPAADHRTGISSSLRNLAAFVTQDESGL